MATDPEDRKLAIEVLRRQLVAKGVSDEDALMTATKLVDEAIKQRGG